MFSNKTVAWLMWFIASLFYAYQYILRVMPNVMMDDIMSKYAIEPGLFGQFSGVYYIGYSLVHIPVGILLDRFGPKKILPILMLVTVAGMLPLIISDFWMYPIIGRVFVGIGSSSAILGLFKVIRMAFPEEKFAWMLSLGATIGLLGAIYGGAPVQYLHHLWGFNQVILLAIVLGVLLALLTFLIIPPYDSVNQSESVWQDIKSVLGNAKVIGICLLAGLMVGPLEGFADVWATTFLKTVYGMESSAAAGLPSLMFLGMGLGGPVLSFIAEKTRSYLGVVLACAIIMGAAFLFLLMTTSGVGTLSLLFFVVGILCAYQILAIAYVATCVPKQAAGLSSAATNMIIMIFGYFFHSVISKIVGVYSISPAGLVYGVSVIPIALGVAALGFGWLLWSNRFSGKIQNGLSKGI